MLRIRPFQNADLPFLLEVWLGHWAAARQAPSISVTAMERAIVSRMFFDPNSLSVALVDDRPVAWCHHPIVHEEASEAAVTLDPFALISAICFAGEAGLSACDELLKFAESQLRDRGVDQVLVGPVRDHQMGYAGLSPIGHGIGVPVADARTASLLSRHGYKVARCIERHVAATSTYRPEFNRDFLNLRRRTRVDRMAVLPTDHRTAVAMSHFDIERQVLFDHLHGHRLAAIELWLSDVEVPVMDGSRAIMSLELLHPVELTDGSTPAIIGSTRDEDRSLSIEEQFLIVSVIPTLAIRNIYSVEIAVDETSSALIAQLEALRFTATDQGRQWTKSLVADAG